MKLHAVIQRALTDEKFALELREKASKADEGGVDSSEWASMLMLFAETPEELSRMTARSGSKPDRTTVTTTTTFGTLTMTFTFTTLACGVTTTTTLTTTTTTTTTSHICPKQDQKPRK